MINKIFFDISHFVPLEENTPHIFGFAEFLTGLALMVIVWTIADVRYRFRIQIAPIPLLKISYLVIVLVGILTLLTDLWRAEQWSVPQGKLITPSGWQVLLAAMFLLTFLIWVWFAIIRPPIFGKMNAKRYAQTLYRIILKGSPTELSVIADEFSLSAKALVCYATNRDKLTFHRNTEQGKNTKLKINKTAEYADRILLLIGDINFCHVVVESSPGTAQIIFQEIQSTKKYGILIETFGRNVINEALLYKNSFIYREYRGHETGLIGYYKPLTSTIFANYKMVEAVGLLPFINISNLNKWDVDQLEAFCNITLFTFQDYVNGYFEKHSIYLYNTVHSLAFAVSDLYKLNEVKNYNYDDEVVSRLKVLINFINRAVEIIEKANLSVKIHLRTKPGINETFYDHLANLLLELIFYASKVRYPHDQCWRIQCHTVWLEFFNSTFKFKSQAAKIIKYKVRRLIYDEILYMSKFPNFRSATILGYCLNVMGLKLEDKKKYKDSYALHKTIISWTQKNYAWLISYNPNIAQACLVDLELQQKNGHKVKTMQPCSI